jgi:hypothetical protein
MKKLRTWHSVQIKSDFIQYKKKALYSESQKSRAIRELCYLAKYGKI